MKFTGRTSDQRKCSRSALTDAYVDKRVAGKKGAMLLNGKLSSLTILKTGLCIKRLRNRINGEVKSTKASYYASAFIQSNGDSRKTWQLINELEKLEKN